MVDRKAFFELPVKSLTETYEKITDLGNNDYYTTGNLLDYEYFRKYYKLIAIDLSKQKELENNDIMQQVNFTGKLMFIQRLLCFSLSRNKKKLL